MIGALVTLVWFSLVVPRRGCSSGRNRRAMLAARSLSGWSVLAGVFFSRFLRDIV